MATDDESKRTESPRARRTAAARGALGAGGTRAARRARLAAARLGARGVGVFPGRFVARPLAVCAAACCASAGSSCSRSPCWRRWRRSCGFAGRRRATSPPVSTATPAPSIVRRRRSPTASPTTRTLSPAPSGPNTRRGSPVRSRRSASPRPPRGWPSATPMRCVSPPALLAFAAAVAAGPELYNGLAAAFDWRGGDARPQRPEAASTPGSTRRPMPAARPW